jgi:hypothetical protein
MMEMDGIFRRCCTNPMVLMGVSLIDLVTNLLRMDLHVLNEERFLKFTLETPPLTMNQPAL